MSLTELEEFIEDCRAKLFTAREKRIHPLKDDKILVSWNGLMIAALARGYQALGDDACSRSAMEAADFILDAMRPGGRLHRRYRKGEVAYPAYADDYAFLIWGLLELYESVFKLKYLEEAIRLQEQMTKLFEDRSEGGFFFSGLDSENMIVREKDIHDGAVPSSNSIAALNLLRLGRMTGNPAWEEQADYPYQVLCTAGWAFSPGPYQLSPGSRFLHRPGSGNRHCRKGPGCPNDKGNDRRRPPALFAKPGHSPEGIRSGRAAKLAGLAPYTAAMHAAADGPAAFVCEKYRCGKPVFTLQDLEIGPSRLNYGVIMAQLSADGVIMACIA